MIFRRSIMKEKSGTTLNWILYSVSIVVIPIIFKIIAYRITTDNFPDTNYFFADILLVLLSISCSLFSISYETYKIKKEKNNYIFCTAVISGIFSIMAWSFYIFSFSEKINKYSFLITVGCIFILIILIGLGIIIGKENEKNYNSVIYNMHNNCLNIMNQLINKNVFSHLKTHIEKHNELLCHPDVVQGIEEEIEVCLGEIGVNNE